MAVRFAGASGGCGAVLRKTIGMRSALLCAYSAEELFIIEQCRAVCGPPGIAFSRVGSWRKTASAALVSCGNSRAAGRTLSGSRRSPAVPLSGFAIFPPTGGKPFHSGGAFCHLLVSANEAPPSGELARERLRGFDLSFWESWHRVAMTERARVLTVCSSAGSLFLLTSPLFRTIILQK